MRKALFSLLFALGLLIVPTAAHADVNDFTVTDFTADYYLTHNDPQGSLDIHEKIAVDFPGQNHGILRALPQRYNGQNEHLHVASVMRDGQSEPYTTYTSSGNEVLKIGNAAQTITGTHVYDISYSVQNVIRFTSSGDELDWNTNGTEWSQPFEHISATLHMPAGFNLQKISDNRCATGAYRSSASDCTVEVNGQGDGYTYQTTRVLSSGETMTFIDSFPIGTFQKPTAADWWRDNGFTLAVIILPVITSFIAGYRKWHRDGKDLKGKGTIIPEYSPPDGMRAALADTLLHYSPSNKAVSATLIDLAIRGHLKIVETTSDGVLGLGKHKRYSFEKLESDASDLSDFEQTLYDGLFSHGSSVTTADLKDSYYTTVNSAKAQISAHLVNNGYVPGQQFGRGWWMWIVALAEFALAAFIHSAASLGFLMGGLIFVGFSALMSKRTQKGVDAKDALQGLKLYMDTAEKDRLAMLQSTKAPYAEKTAEPVRTVDLFEKLLPYAIVLGVETSWAKQFEGIYTTPPDWYGGNWTAFNAGFLVGSLNDSMSAMNSSFAAPSSAGSGGAGGFSGGGGGGGGGGGW